MDDPTPNTRALWQWRLLYSAIALGMIPIGLAARSMRGDADASDPVGYIATYLGDTLWAVMFFFLFAALWPRSRTAALATLTLTFTIAIELSQLYHGEPLDSLRSFAPTRFLLGSHFLWSDVICLTVGTALATGLHLVLPRPKAVSPANTDKSPHTHLSI